MKPFTAAEPPNWRVFYTATTIFASIFLIGVLIVFSPWMLESPPLRGTVDDLERPPPIVIRTSYGS